MNPESLESTPKEKEEKKPKRIFLEVGINDDFIANINRDKCIPPVVAGGEKEWRPEEMYIGIERSLYNLKKTREIMSYDSIPDLTGLPPLKITPEKYFFVQGDAQRNPLRDGSVETIFFGNIFGDPDIEGKVKRGFLREAKRILKEDGEIIILETRSPQIAKEGLVTEAGRLISPEYHAWELREWPKLMDLLKEAGFTKVDCIYADSPQWAEEVGKYSGKAKKLMQVPMSFLPDETPFLVHAKIKPIDN